LVALKSVLFSILSFFGRLFSPLGRVLLEFIILPVYGFLYATRRRLSIWYRPAKNRLMFFLSNRYSLHGAVIVVALVAIGVNLQFQTVRAETGTFGEKSLLYGIVTNQEVETIDEYADLEHPETYANNSYLSDSTLRGDSVALNTDAPVVASSSSVLNDGIIVTATTSTSTADTVAPREGTIEYGVQSGDTLSTIAEKFNISLNTLLWANGLTVKSVIKPGVTLKILPVTGVEYTVKNGETLIGISKKLNASSDDILAFNKLEGSSALKIGQTLVVPGGTPPATVVAVRPTTNTSVTKLFVAPPSTSGSGAKPAAGKMSWPTDLTYIVRGLSLTHTGVDIDCNGHSNGTSTNDNYAAADGIVQFAGTKNGYGNAVEINHGNGLVTRYGHFYTLYVKKGQQVTAGTPLGRCGSTGNSTGTHLHFEVIINGKFQNPLNYLR
jgi:LysM repeat protein